MKLALAAVARGKVLTLWDFMLWTEGRGRHSEFQKGNIRARKPVKRPLLLFGLRVRTTW